MDTVYAQVQGKDRGQVEEAGQRLGLEGTYIPHSYIELVQIGHLTEVSAAACPAAGCACSKQTCLQEILSTFYTRPRACIRCCRQVY
jgi:hypothetical protein